MSTTDLGLRRFELDIESQDIIPEIRCLECDESYDPEPRDGGYCSDCREEAS